MRRLWLMFVLFLIVPPAFPDTITDFSFHSELSDGYAAQGLITVDTSTGYVINSHFTLSQNGVLDAFFTTPNYSQPLNGAYLAQFADNAHGFTYELLLPMATLVSYGGGSVCTTTRTCLGYPSGVYLPGGSNAVALNGSLAPTPEPASLVLLGSGLLLGFLLWRGNATAEKAHALDEL